MMTREEVKKAVLDLSSEDRFQLMLDIGPALCRGIMERPGGKKQMMLRMMPVCSEMMIKKVHALAGMIKMKLSEMRGSDCFPIAEIEQRLNKLISR